MQTNPLIEQLAELEHQQWCHWAQSLLANEPHLSPVRADRWRKEMIPYHALSEERKELDRVWARRVIALITQEKLP